MIYIQAVITLVLITIVGGQSSSFSQLSVNATSSGSDVISFATTITNASGQASEALSNALMNVFSEITDDTGNTLAVSTLSTSTSTVANDVLLTSTTTNSTVKGVNGDAGSQAQANAQTTPDSNSPKAASSSLSFSKLQNNTACLTTSTNSIAVGDFSDAISTSSSLAQGPGVFAELYSTSIQNGDDLEGVTLTPTPTASPAHSPTFFPPTPTNNTTPSPFLNSPSLLYSPSTPISPPSNMPPLNSPNPSSPTPIISPPPPPTPIISPPPPPTPAPTPIISPPPPPTPSTPPTPTLPLNSPNPQTPPPLAFPPPPLQAAFPPYPSPMQYLYTRSKFVEYFYEENVTRSSVENDTDIGGRGWSIGSTPRAWSGVHGFYGSVESNSRTGNDRFFISTNGNVTMIGNNTKSGATFYNNNRGVGWARINAVGDDLYGTVNSSAQGKFLEDGEINTTNATAIASAAGADFLNIIADVEARRNNEYAKAAGKAGGEDAVASVYAATSKAGYGFNAVADNINISVIIRGDNIETYSNAQGKNVTASFLADTQNSNSTGDAIGDDIKFSVDADDDGLTSTVVATGGPNATDSTVPDSY